MQCLIALRNKLSKFNIDLLIFFELNKDIASNNNSIFVILNISSEFLYTKILKIY